jgi:acyl-CoA synthetase (AMP-forming)/AMP-acid ligase II
VNTLEILNIAAAIVPDRLGLIAPGSPGVRISFAGLLDRSARLAAGLAAAGVERGQRVAMVEVNAPEHAEAYFACARLDAIFVPLNFRSRAGELRWMLRDVDARAVIAGGRYAALLDEALDDGGRRPVAVALGEAAPAGWLSYSGLISGSHASDAAPSAGDDDPTMIIFTSGASARPKGVVLTHASFSSYVVENVTPADPDPASEERTILTVPLYHIAGLQALMAAVYGGRTVVVQPQFEPEGWLKLVQDERVNRAMLVPTMLRALIEHPSFGEFDLSSLRVITYGAAAMSAEVLERAIAAFPQARLINAFGQTESAATITMLGPDDHVLSGSPEEVAKKRRRLGSIGKPLPDVDVRVVDERGEEVPPGVTGEIVARGARLMKGYWGRPDATAEALRGGWLHTGDLGYRDEDGYIFLKGRAREIIKRGGEMISPEEVEEVLERHPAVVEAAVIGVPDAEWGEVVEAVVVVRRDARVTEGELIEHCRRQIASFKKPEAVHFVPALPRNQLGKVLRGQLRDRFGRRPAV